MRKKLRPLFSLRTIAVTETLLAIGALVIVNMIFFNGDRFAGINPHPFWFVIILISAQYGVTEGTFAVIVATIAFLYGNVRPRLDGEYLYSYLLDVSEQPLLWLISAVIIGSLRFRHVMERNRLRDDLADALQREEVVAVHYEQLRSIRETLEQRLVRHIHTSIDTYNAAKLMESYSPGKILEGVQDLVSALLSPKKFSVFMLNGDSLDVLLRYGWETANEFKTAIPSSDAIFEYVIGDKHTLCIVSEKDERTLMGQGMLAGPIMAESGQILGMLKIEDIHYADLHVSTVETFKVICTWIGNAYFQAQSYETASSHSYIDLEKNIYSYAFFKLQSDYTTFLARRFNFDLSLIVVKFVESDDISPERYKAAIQQLEGAVTKNLRAIDQIFNYRLAENTYYILLPGTPENNTEIVIEKIANAFAISQKDAATNLKLSFSVQPLHTKNQA